jgi:DNA-binding XRE family transcriptional regulator
MAWETSPMPAPGPAAAIPACNARSVALIIATLAGGSASPTMKLMAESATTPPLETARSSDSRSPEHGVVDGRADVVAEWPASEGWLVVDVAGQRSGLGDHGLGPPVDVLEVGAYCAAALQRLQDLGDQGSCVLGSAQFSGAQDFDQVAPETALDAHVSPETLRKIESGRVATPAFPIIAAIADVLGLSLDAVWAQINQPECGAEPTSSGRNAREGSAS